MNHPKKRHFHHNKNRNRTPRGQSERPSMNKVYDSNGPTGRQRGNASTLYEKYMTLARDANASGDRILSESYKQHAEHYLRIVHQIQDYMQAQAASNQREHAHNRDYNRDRDAVQPVTEQQPSETARSDMQEERPAGTRRRGAYPYARRKPMMDPSEAPQPDMPDADAAAASTPATMTALETQKADDVTEAPAAPRRGRPRKRPLEAASTAESATEEPPVKKRRVVRRKKAEDLGGIGDEG